VLRLRRSTCAISDHEDAVDYLDSRRVWPLPAGCTLRAHASAEYFDGEGESRRFVGRFPAIVADVRDIVIS
jgi:hypothetical protein